MDQKTIDILIVGAGPIGLACAIEAKKNNYEALVIEKGCIVNSIFNYPTNMTFFSTSDRLEIGEVPFISHGVKPTRTEALEYYRRVVDSFKLNIKTYEKVIKVKRTESKFEIETTKSNYTAKYVIISTGFFDFANLMNVPGEELEKVFHYYIEPHPFAYKNIAVIGAGNSAVDVALETYRRGAKVTMIIRGEKIEDNVKYWVKPDIENRIKEGEIKAFFNSKIEHINKETIIIKTSKEIITIENDFVFAMTGYRPDFEFLKSVGIEIRDNEKMIPIFNPENYESNIPKLFLAGVVCGGMETGKWFIENARIHAPQIFTLINKYENQN